MSSPVSSAPAESVPRDRLGRWLRDLRLSVTDHCNLRCQYCLPAELFGPNFRFLPEAKLLSFDELELVADAFIRLGVQKIRLTGGEPLLRRNLAQLVRRLREIPGGVDIALTTNGLHLERQVEALALAGLGRINVSMDALDPQVAACMAGREVDGATVIRGIHEALRLGLPVKVNTVLKRGVNDSEILPLARWCREHGLPLRFIEYMDVGSTNGWQPEDVVRGAETLAELRRHYDLEPVSADYPGEVARRYRYTDGAGEVGFINSVSAPFCGDCTRARVSADGTFYTCLFASKGCDLKPLLRGGPLSPEELARWLAERWHTRRDRYSEERGLITKGIQARRPEMWTLGG